MRKILEALVSKYQRTIALVDKRIQRDFSDEKAPSRRVWGQLKSVNQSILDLILKGQQAMALQQPCL